jgi:hypothetical protein
MSRKKYNFGSNPGLLLPRIGTLRPSKIAIDHRNEKLEALTVAVLDALDLQNLTKEQRYIVDQIYQLCGKLEECRV